MQRPRAGRIVAILLLATLAAGCSGSGGGTSKTGPLLDPATPPTLTTGDHWHYTVTRAGSNPGQANLTVDVVSTTASIELGGKAFPAVHVDSVLTQRTTGGSLRLQVDRLQRTDFAQLHGYANQTLGKTATNGTTSRFETEFFAPCRQWPWPLQTGASMFETCTTHDSGPGTNRTGSSTYSATVEGIETVTVPAGTFLAFRINYTASFPGGLTVQELRWWAPAACNEIRTFQQGGAYTETTELIDFSCAKAPRAAVGATARTTA